ncbi:MAG: UbiA family prenyltransferase [Bacteroidota bacterium]|nr:UbiA family prenyltransferase [Bacteroidota bacterium]
MLKSNIFISVAAVFLAIETQIQLGMRPQWHPYLFIIFFATLFEYNLHRFVTVITNKEALNSDKHSWVKQHLLLFYALVAASVIGFVISLFFAKKGVLITLAPIALITVFYSMPVYKVKKNIFRLREIHFLKIFLIAFVWSTITVLLPVIQSENSFNTNHIVLILTERFLFIFAITIPFDIRDMEIDRQSGLKTIPLLIGETRAYRLSNILLGIFFVICLFHYITHNSYSLLYPLVISAASTFLFLNVKAIGKIPDYHFGILDGTMLLQGLLVYLFWYMG